MKNRGPKMTDITSNTNQQFKIFLSLTESKGLKKENLFLLSGQNLVREFLTRPELKLTAEILMDGMTATTSEKLGSKIFKLSKELFNQIDVLGTHSPILVLEQPVLSEWTLAESIKELTVATPLGDPGNLGALVRSAEAFGIKNMILLQESANPFLPKSVKASAGSVCRMSFHKGPRLQDFVQLKIANLMGLDMKGLSLKEFQWPQDGVLLVGEEGSGLPKNPNMKTLSIPTEKVDSLNATVAASIALYDYYSKVKSRK